MNSLSAIQQTLFQTQSSLKTSPVQLQDGEVVLGRIIKFLPNDNAIVQIGSQTMNAQLETAVEAMKSYWFQVSVTGSSRKLKVLEFGVKGQTQSLPEQLLQAYGVPVKKESKAFIQLLMKNQVPFTQKQLLTGLQWLLNQSNETPQQIQQNMDSLLFVLKRKWPITPSVVDAIKASRTSSITEQLNTLVQQLDSKPNKTQGEEKLLRVLQELFKRDLESQFNNSLTLNQPTHTKQDAVKLFIQMMTKQLGLNTEKVLKKGNPNELKHQIATVKSLIVSAIGDTVEPSIRMNMERVLAQLNGQSLLTHDQGPFAFLYVSLPLLLKNWLTDWNIQMYGRKQKDGSIDPSHCRIVFDLNLKSIQNTLVDVRIQQKIVTVQLYNDILTKEFITPLLHQVRGSFEKMGYQLTSVTVHPFNRIVNEQESPLIHQIQSVKKVDVKI